MDPETGKVAVDLENDTVIVDGEELSYEEAYARKYGKEEKRDD